MEVSSQTEKVIRKLSKFFNVLRDSIRLEILMVLLQEDRSLSFSEIKANLKSEYSAPNLSYHIRALEDSGIIKNERRLDTSSGKARTSFYRLTPDGEKVIKALLEIAKNFTTSNY